MNIIRKSVLSLLKIIDVGKKYSLKNKIHYINDNFDKFMPNIIEQLSNQVSTKKLITYIYLDFLCFHPEFLLNNVAIKVVDVV